FQARDLARCEEADLLPGEAEAAVHVERRLAVAKEAAVEATDELSQVPRPAAEPDREGELAAVRVTGEHEGRTEAGRPRGGGGGGGGGGEQGAGGGRGGGGGGSGGR